MPDIETVRWIPGRAQENQRSALPPMMTAVGRGLLCRCPACGRGRIFTGYLRVTPECGVCHAPLGLARADDAPPYFTIFLVGHVIVLGMLMLEQSYSPPLWVHAMIWLPLAVILCLTLLRPIKGGTVGLMLKLGMMKSDDGD